jgi:PhzF family phenazine biosynthesis protein
MQHIAQEMNLSETAFLVPQADGFQLRWFTPAAEVDLCGHATLASAHILWQTGLLPSGEAARFHTKSGLLTTSLTDGWIELDFPATPEEPAPTPPALAAGLNAPIRYTGRDIFDYLVELETELAVRQLEPDLGLLATLPVRGVIVTSRADTSGYDFVSRFFAPAVGVPEDPVTGSAHSCLGPYWRKNLGKETFLAYQASRRGGVLRVKVIGDRVRIAGQAVTILEGSLKV